MEKKLPRPLLGMFRSKGAPPPLPNAFAEQGANLSPAVSYPTAPAYPTATSHQSGFNAATEGSIEPAAALGPVADEPQRASWYQMRQEAQSGVAQSERTELANSGTASQADAVGAVSPGMHGSPVMHSMVVPVGEVVHDAIASANQQLALRTAAHMNMVIAVVLEQRDAALAQLATLSQMREAEHAQLSIEHDRFVTDLLQEHGTKQAELERQLRAARDAAERQRVLGSNTLGALSSNVPALNLGAAGPGLEASQLREQVGDLRRLLEGAYLEVDSLRALVPRLEEERDAALRDLDDTRVQLYSEIEAARDEGSALQVQLDDAHRQAEEARDQVRDEAHAWSERLNDTERELDERRGEVTRMRERMDLLAMEVQHSRPPPPATSDELVRARDESQQLRKELIDTKRQLSRITREFAVAKLQRQGARAPQVGNGAALGAGIAAKTPVPE